MSWEPYWDFTKSNWGSLASVAGLAVSIATLIVAQKAKQAADAAKKEALRRNLAEELQDAVRKAEQVGLFLAQRKWDVVFLRAQEVTSVCSLVLRRWEAELPEQSKDNILKAQVQSGRIADVAMRGAVAAPSEEEFRIIATAQQRTYRLLSGELGASLATVERGK